MTKKELVLALHKHGDDDVIAVRLGMGTVNRINHCQLPNYGGGDLYMVTSARLAGSGEDDVGNACVLELE